MAYRSFNQRFPKFKWILFLSILITLPLTVFSVQKVSTSTEQHAASSSLPAPKITLVTSKCSKSYVGDYNQVRVSVYWAGINGASFYVLTTTGRGNYADTAETSTVLPVKGNPFNPSSSNNTEFRTSFNDTIKLQAFGANNVKSPVTVKHYQTVNCLDRPKAL